MSGGKGEAPGAPHERDRGLDIVEGARPLNNFAEGVDNPTVTDADCDRAKQNAENAACLVFPDQPDRGANDKRSEQPVATQEGHQPVEDRIAQGLVAKVEQRPID